MKKSLLYFFVLFSILTPVYSQYHGGSADGFSVKTLAQTSTVPFYNKFTGGSGDGFALKEFKQASTVPYYSKFTGGASDGFAVKTYAGPYLRIATTTMNFSNAASSDTVIISSNTSWTVVSNDSWVTVSPAGYSGKDTITVSVEANTVVTSRTATLIVSSSGLDDQLITVIQAAGDPFLSVSSVSLEIAKDEGSQVSVDVTSNTKWLPASDQEWLTVNPSDSTSGDATLTFTAGKNPEITTRSATVSVSANGLPDQLITVNQAAGDTTLALSSDSVSLADEANSTASVDVTSNATWYASSDQAWLSVSPMSGTGDGSLALIAAENIGEDARTATVTVQISSRLKSTIIVTQEATMATSADNVNVAGDGGTSSVDLVTNTSWTASSDQLWLTVSPSSGTGNATLVFTVEDNPTIYPRTAHVTVTAYGVPDNVITITQAAGDPVLLVSGNTITIDTTASSTNVYVTSNTTWSATSSEVWLTVTPLSYTGDGTITLISEANKGMERTATVVLSAPGAVSQTIYVIQSANTSEGITLAALEDPSPGCEGYSVSISYTVLTGVPTHYRIIFGEQAISEGFQNTDYFDLPSSVASGTITIEIPENIADGTYNAYLQMDNDSGTESPVYPFTFTVKISSDYIISKFDDVLICDNSSGRFSAFQWYKDGSPISGATNQYYCDSDGLNGSYYLKVWTVDGEESFTCAKEFLNSTSSTTGVYVFPNPVESGQICTISIIGFSSDDLEGAVLTIHTLTGTPVFCLKPVAETNNVTIDGAPAIYIGRLKTAYGKSLTFKIIMSK